MENVLSEFREFLDKKQYTALRQLAEDMNPADTAAVLEELEPEDRLKLFRILPKGIAADVFSYLESESQQYIITSLSDKDAAQIVDKLQADDAADLMEEMPANIVKRILSRTTPDTRKDINLLLNYPEDSAGSIMTVEYVDLKESLTVLQAIERVRMLGLDSETINTCYVLGQQRELLGTVALRYLLLSEPDDVIGDIMNENVISVNTFTDQEEVARIFMKYDFTVMPVVDNENRLVGIITIDDIVDIIEQEATEDIEKMAAIVPGDKPYLRTSFFEAYKKRIPWLIFLMISATFTGAIITRFEDYLSTCIVLTAYIPMLMDTGGNSGSQASVEIIRGISLGEITFQDIPRCIFKEFRVAILCGLTLGSANFVKLMLVDHVSMAVAAAVCLTLPVEIVIAKLIGCTLPLTAKKLGFDPAVMASPLITTIVDALSLITYFNIASLILHF